MNVSHVTLLLLLLVGCAGRAPTRPLVVVDPGHTDSDSGTWSCSGRRETEYNDRLAAALVKLLQRDGAIDVLVTRPPKGEISLKDRAEKANAAGAQLFLSLHHDAAQGRYQKERRVEDRRFAVTTRRLRGYSLFVSRENPFPEESLRFARLVGEGMLAMERRPTLHHAEKIPGENRELLDKRLGIHEYTTLAVLRRTKMPAVLLEAGVITDPVDEKYLADENTVLRTAEALTAAVRAFLDQR